MSKPKIAAIGFKFYYNLFVWNWKPHIHVESAEGQTINSKYLRMNWLAFDFYLIKDLTKDK